MNQAIPAWDFLETFRVSAPPLPLPPRPAATWQAVEEWVRLTTESLAEAERELEAEVRRWTLALDPLGEVSQLDWRKFRPLRLSREEAWSDWLGHLIEVSTSGRFACELLGSRGQHPSSAYALPLVEREVRAGQGEYRADLVIQWQSREIAHIEVKVGDQSFEKTFETAELLEKEYGRGRPWHNFILLPAEDADKWLQVAAGRTSVTMLTWTQAATALRCALWSRDESLPWRTWAHSFCGAIEQRLLGILPKHAREDPARSPFERLASAVTQLDVMRGDGR
jgi:hypothetical protein